jgi:hypothetical protein
MANVLSIDNIFSTIGDTSHFELPVASPFRKTFTFSYTGTGDTITAKISGNKRTTGIEIASIVHAADGTYQLDMFGYPKLTGKNDMVLRLRDNKGTIARFPVVFRVVPIKFSPTYLPDATALFTPYTAKISFKNPSNTKPKFGFNFPVEFGRVDIFQGEDYVNITFNPSRTGKFKFIVTALDPNDIVMGHKTVFIKIYKSVEDRDKKKEKTVEPEEDVTVRSVDIKDWK